MRFKALQIVLADDDLDECDLFEAALKEIALPTELTCIHNGKFLMEWLEERKYTIPDLLFLDLMMPGKSGSDCLSTIKQHPDLQFLPVVILSNTINSGIVDTLYANGALYYIQKPGSFQRQIEIISKILFTREDNILVQPSKRDFVISYKD